MSEHEGGPDEVIEDRGREALEHLQVAALEFIEAARAVLDVAEEAVRQPGGLAGMISETLSGFAAAVAEARRPPSAPAEGATDPGPAGVQRIKVS